MKNIIILSSLILGLGFSSCKKKFEELNTNPNAPTSVEPNLLLRQVIYSYGEELSYEGFVAGDLLGQYSTAVDFNLFDRHDLSSAQYGGNPWPAIYRNLRDNELLLEKSRSKTTYAVYEGPALILKAYMTAALTDIYGDVPYSEALQANNGNSSPAFDKQEDIYMAAGGILDNLDKGIAAIQAYTGAITLQGDILFNGNLAAWVTFANSLKIKALMRISDKVNVASQLQAIYTSGNYMNTNSQNAKFSFTATLPNSFRMAALKQGDFNLFVMSLTAQEIMQDSLADPRVAIFYRPAVNFPGMYKGLLNGPNAATTSTSVADFSLMGTIFREETNKLKCNFLTAWETNFFLAEAAQRGYISASAQILYENGVQLAFEYWNVTMPATYLTAGNAQFGANGADPIEQIVTQKWIANIINGYEGWIEFRRTGFPQLKTVQASLNGGLYPVRMPYPGTEAALNGNNYTTAAANTNGNSINTRVWWDIN